MPDVDDQEDDFFVISVLGAKIIVTYGKVSRRAPVTALRDPSIFVGLQRASCHQLLER